MGIYVVTGASSGIGAKTAETLREKGHQVINVDVRGGDVNANLASVQGRLEVVAKLHEMCPEGIDGLVCCAGVSASCGNLKLIMSLNYFGAVAMAEGLYDLLEMRRGACVLVASNSITQKVVRKDLINILNNDEDEPRILALMDNFDPMKDGHSMYVTSKYALARWMRRVSANWAANGVRMNAIAPGNVQTAMTAALSDYMYQATLALPIPTMYGKDMLMDPADIANAIAFLVSPEGHGVNGVVLFCDGGTDALLNSEKVC